MESAPSSSNDPRLEALLAEQEIRHVLQIYCHAVDRRDLDLLQSIYHDDATENHVHFEGRARDFGPYIMPSLSERGFRLGNHHLTGVLVALHGDQADTESYFYSIARRLLDPQDEDGPSELVVLSGRYLDRFERRDARWRIADRRVVLDLDFTTPYTPARADGVVLIRGSLGADDAARGLFAVAED